MKFERGSMYEVNYGKFSKAATFTYHREGVNYFFDINGEFGFSDKFLASGEVVVTEMDND